MLRRAWEWIDRFWPLLLSVLLIVGVVCTVAGSSDFQACIKNTSSPQSDHKTNSGDASVSSVSNGYQSCLGKFIVDNDPGISAVSTFIIAIFTIVLAGVTGRQARLTKEALIADKAAFVFPDGYMQWWEQDPISGLYNWRLRPSWRNSGDTAALDMIVHVECEIRNTVLPPGFNFRVPDQNPHPGMLGPKFSSIAGLAPPMGQAAITPQDILDAQNFNKFIYLWGWARYRDVFSETRTHVTTFCWLVMVTGNPFAYVPNTPGQPPTPGTLAFTWIQHNEGNTTRDE